MSECPPSESLLLLQETSPFHHPHPPSPLRPIQEQGSEHSRLPSELEEDPAELELREYLEQAPVSNSTGC